MINEILLLLIVAVPIILSFGAVIIPSDKARSGFAVAVALATFCLGAMLAPEVFSGQIVSVKFPMPLGINFILKADVFALFCALVSSLISAVIIFYSTEYIKKYPNQKEYYFIVLLFLGSMMGIIFTANLIFLYVFWELTALASWRLIGFFRQDDYVRRANKAFLITVSGALVMLVGFIIVYDYAGSFDYDAIRAAAPTGTLISIASLCIITGIFTKSATFPFHTWLADAGVAPSPVTALLHAAVLVKIGVYVYARLFSNIIILDDCTRTVVLIAITVSAILSGFAALRETDIKRIIAFSTVSQLAFMFLGFAAQSKMAFAGAVLFMAMHSAAKAGLFLTAGIIEHHTHTKNINDMGGLLKYIPFAAVAFGFCMLSVIGVPPLGGFFAKFMVLAGALLAGDVTFFVLFMFAAVLTIVYLIRVFYKVFLGEVKIVPTGTEHALSPMTISVLILAALSLAGGLTFGELSKIAELAATQMLGI
jgi:NADH:ubiquinone oxidoreductase subunit 5 (subunit L)/multisubunit Na+/H+ antiporter MnhA subunit